MCLCEIKIHNSPLVSQVSHSYLWNAKTSTSGNFNLVRRVYARTVHASAHAYTWPTFPYL